MRFTFLTSALIFFALILLSGCGRKSPQPGGQAGTGAQNPDSTRTPATVGAADSLLGSAGKSAMNGNLPFDGRPAALMDTTLVRGRAGAVHIGMPADSVYIFYGRSHIREADLQLEGLSTPSLEISLPGGTEDYPSLVAEIDKKLKTVIRIRVHDPRFHTAKGIGPWSTLAVLREQYPVESIEPGETDTLAPVNMLGMSFVLDPSAIPPEFSRTRNQKLISGSTRLTAVLVWGMGAAGKE